ncbi:conserved Plasmodium protein, unknown function [Plasmodium vinckei brucechwatti]|uniref:Uncharacterized protein n=1 Tax=Plasmodium vinckei brucechwatti TaxID=119398 RepID=A0A6V7S7I4_PLAVN|nr:conserved Plasmodium protein, unknown function [Plasmodium vinckei brucechwatti]
MENRELSFEKYQLINKSPCCNQNGEKQYLLANEPNDSKNGDAFSDCLKVAEDIKKKIIYEQFDAILSLYSKILKENKRKKCASKEINEKVEEAINTALEIYSLIENNNEKTKKIYLKKISSICDILYNLIVEYTKNDNNKQLEEGIKNHEPDQKGETLKDSCKEESGHIAPENLKQISEENKAKSETEKSNGNTKERNKVDEIEEINKMMTPFCSNIKKERKKKEYLYSDFSRRNNLLCLYGASELNEKYIYNPYKKMKSFKFYKNIDKNLRINKRSELIERFEKIMKNKEKINISQSEKKINKPIDLKKLLLRSRKSVTKFELDKNGDIKTVIEFVRKYEDKKNVITHDGYDNNFLKNKKLSNLNGLKKGKNILSEKCGAYTMQRNKSNCSTFSTNIYENENEKIKIIESSTQDSSGNGEYVYPEKSRCNKKTKKDRYKDNLDFYMQNMNDIKLVNYYDEDEIIMHILKESEQKKNKNKTKLGPSNNKILQHSHASLRKYGGGVYEDSNERKLNYSFQKNVDSDSEFDMNKYEVLNRIYNLNQNKKDAIIKLDEEKYLKEINALQNNENKQMDHIKILSSIYNDKNRCYQKICECGTNQISSIFLLNCFEKNIVEQIEEEAEEKVEEKVEEKLEEKVEEKVEERVEENLQPISVHKRMIKKKTDPILEKIKYQLSQLVQLESKINPEDDSQISGSVNLESEVKSQGDNKINKSVNLESEVKSQGDNKISKSVNLESEVKSQGDNKINKSVNLESEVKSQGDNKINKSVNLESEVKSQGDNKISGSVNLESRMKPEDDNKIEIEENETKINYEQMPLGDKENRAYSITKIASIISKINKIKSSIYNENQSNENETNIKIEGFIFNENLKDMTIKSYSINNKSSKNCIKYITNQQKNRLNDNKIRDENNEEGQTDLVLSKKGTDQTSKEKGKKSIGKNKTSSLSNSLTDDMDENALTDLSDFMKRESSNNEDTINESLSGMETISRDLHVANDNESFTDSYLKSGFFSHVHIMLSDTNIITRKCKIFYDSETKKLGIMRDKKVFKIDVSKLMIQEIPSLEPNLAIIKIIFPQNCSKLLIVESNDFLGLQALGDKIGWNPDNINQNALKNKRKGKKSNAEGMDYKLNNLSNKI